MDVAHTFGHAGRARRIEPERGLVGMGRGGRELIALGREFFSELLMAVRLAA